MFDRRVLLRLLAAAPLAQMQMAQQQTARSNVIAPPTRERVVPMEFIVKFKLRSTQTTYGPFLLGADGLAYDFDEVMRAMFEMTREHWESPRK